MKKIRIVLCSFFFLIINFLANAQPEVHMADTMRKNGKIYVVIAVMLTILLGLIFYIARLDRKITRMEKNR